MASDLDKAQEDIEVTGEAREPELDTDVVDDEDLIEEGEIAGDYLEQLLDVLDFDGDIDLDVEGDRAVVRIDGGKDLSKLVGSNGNYSDINITPIQKQ